MTGAWGALLAGRRRPRLAVEEGLRSLSAPVQQVEDHVGALQLILPGPEHVRPPPPQVRVRPLDINYVAR
eukprot:CAMPEP_0118929628 /NCGR_PEP_ID=MMETSP1169-20130426/6574_1 /TAXON_ID=36882 /ORGANISM="Pyramimonas obovata, Strain CCMP722" /LENGTH=69 /DNA_ID=CAMNT_0006871859 /DNA_START=219 /DNA_END=428 /DNA_ORIENTATION=-